MENLCDLLFELSSTERMRILQRLRNGRLKLSHISQELSITVTETSRHLQRLQEAGLLGRDSDSLYYLTNYGESALTLLGGLDILAENKDYVLNHDLSVLPPEFVQRLGAFKGARLVEDTLTGIRLTEMMYQKASEYIWVLSEQILVSALPFIKQSIDRGAEFRFLFPEDISPPPGFEPMSGTLERCLPDVKIRLAVTEKEALICLPYLHGALDYTPFIGDEPEFIQWCRELFLYFWSLGSSLSG
jgi:predicted transcriptional regulator